MTFRKSIVSSKLINRGEIVVANPKHGAEATFFGVVRAHNLGRDVVAVSYDAHASLCEAVFDGIIARIDSAHDVLLVHRTGRLVVGEISVAIAVSSVHRAEAFAACREIIEAVKHEAPIWKQEHYVDGDSDWVKGHSLCR